MSAVNGSTGSVGSQAGGLAGPPHVGLVFQFYNLLPVLTAERNVELPLLLTHLSAKERQQHVRDGALGGGSHTAGPDTIRGSSRVVSSSGSASPGPSSPIRRCCCATSPPAISTASRATRSWILLQALNQEQGKTVVMVTHDPHAAARAGRVLYLDKGRLSTEPLE